MKGVVLMTGLLQGLLAAGDSLRSCVEHTSGVRKMKGFT